MNLAELSWFTDWGDCKLKQNSSIPSNVPFFWQEGKTREKNLSEHRRAPPKLTHPWRRVQNRTQAILAEGKGSHHCSVSLSNGICWRTAVWLLWPLKRLGIDPLCPFKRQYRQNLAILCRNILLYMCIASNTPSFFDRSSRGASRDILKNKFKCGLNLLLKTLIQAFAILFRLQFFPNQLKTLLEIMILRFSQYHFLTAPDIPFGFLSLHAVALWSWSYFAITQLDQISRYILNTSNLGSPIGAFKAALKLRPRIVRVSAGSMIPSSHNLQRKTTIE